MAELSGECSGRCAVMTRRIWSTLVLVGCALLGACSDPGQPEAPFEIVQLAPLELQLQASGQLRAARSTPLQVPGSNWSRRQLHWMVAEGSRVAAGDLVARFGADDSEVELAKAQVDLLRNALDRDRLYTRLWRDVAVSPRLARLLQAERRDLHKGRHRALDLLQQRIGGKRQGHGERIGRTAQTLHVFLPTEQHPIIGAPHLIHRIAIEETAIERAQRRLTGIVKPPVGGMPTTILPTLPGSQ